MKKVKLGKTYKLFVLPILICFFAFNTFPLINAVVYSLTDSRGFGDFNWVGFQNYFDMFKDSRILNSYLFTFKFAILVLVILLSILFYRPFCKWICPLGAIYSLFNSVSFLKLRVDSEKCVGCQKCSHACKMDVNVTDTPNHPECIRCGACMKACPTNAICYHYGFSTRKQADNK